jgi:hypothetical protein
VRERAAPEWVTAGAARAFALVPTELYARSTKRAAAGDITAAARPLAALAATGVVLQALGLFVFGLVLNAPGSSGARRVVPMRAAWGRTLPGLSPGASAVALAQLRLALRTPRGRSILLSPLIMLCVFGAIMWRNVNGMNLGAIDVHGGLGLAAFTSFVCLMSTLPITMNQFAIDRAGLTLALLSPLSDRDYLMGKAVGNALIAMPPALFCTLVSLAVFPGGSPGLWLAIPLSLLATYLIVAPLAAIFSAIFPRVVDLNSIGRGSNAHGLSGLLGLLSFLAAGTPCLLLVLAARLLNRPGLTPVFLLVWCGLSLGIGALLFIPAQRVFAKRRENLAMLRATGGVRS